MPALWPGVKMPADVVTWGFDGVIWGDRYFDSDNVTVSPCRL
ncbi:hypothetical protein FDUTEX481_09738 [Tolypothrix sp. PCC 7601]|nr:hypothetical protein FDUTEX481_09738 [Tolypothrix sp. PCC 7601]